MQGCTWSLEPGPFTGPHHIAQWQDGCSQAQSRAVYCHHNGFLEVDECQHKVPKGVTEWSAVTLSRLMVTHKRVAACSGVISSYRTASAMRLLSFLRSVDRRPIRYDGSRPLQKTVPTELSSSNLLSSAAALPKARQTSFMIWRERRTNVYYILNQQKRTGWEGNSLNIGSESSE